MKTRFLAEIGSNHNGSLTRALALVDAAAEAGFSGVKFQQFRIKELYAQEAIAADPEIRDRKLLELPEEWNVDLADRAHSHGLTFGTTPFYLSCVERLTPLMDFWKVASYQLLLLDHLRGLARTGKPIVVSTGMASMDECLEARKALMEAGAMDLTFMHCVSAYPAPIGEANLRAIDTMQKVICWPIGYSDHTHSGVAITRAVLRWRASMVEMHLDLEDGCGAENVGGHTHCWSPRHAKTVIQACGALPQELMRDHASDGSGVKECQLSELTERSWRSDPYDGLRPRLDVRARIARSPQTVQP